MNYLKYFLSLLNEIGNFILMSRLTFIGEIISEKLKLRQMSTVSNIQVLPKIKYNTINVSLNKHTSRFLTFTIKYLSIIY